MHPVSPCRTLVELFAPQCVQRGGLLPAVCSRRGVDLCGPTLSPTVQQTQRTLLAPAACCCCYCCYCCLGFHRWRGSEAYVWGCLLCRQRLYCCCSLETTPSGGGGPNCVFGLREGDVSHCLLGCLFVCLSVCLTSCLPSRGCQFVVADVLMCLWLTDECACACVLTERERVWLGGGASLVCLLVCLFACLLPCFARQSGWVACLDCAYKAFVHTSLALHCTASVLVAVGVWRQLVNFCRLFFRSFGDSEIDEVSPIS
jgi:streptolysin S family bacteriocin protoxin